MKGPSARQEEVKEQLPAAEGVILDAAEIKAGDRVVYPNQGVCRITGVESKEIAGQKLELVRMEREEDGAAVLVPKGKVPTIGLRRVASGDQIEGVFHYLAAQYDDPELDWKIRHRDNADRLIAGGVLGVAEVVKGLHALSRIRPLPAKEREQYDNARHLLVHEIAVSLGVPPALAEDYVDYALMPPAGVTFKLKPPPKPVELPARPRRRVVRSSEDDLGLDDLGLEVEVPEAGAAEEGAPAEAEEAGAEGATAGADESAPAIPSPDELPLPDGLGDLDVGRLADELVSLAAEGEEPGPGEPLGLEGGESEGHAEAEEGAAEGEEAEEPEEPEGTEEVEEAPPEEDEAAPAPRRAARKAEAAAKKKPLAHARKGKDREKEKAPAKKAARPARPRAEPKPTAKKEKAPAKKPAPKGKKK